MENGGSMELAALTRRRDTEELDVKALVYFFKLKLNRCQKIWFEIYSNILKETGHNVWIFVETLIAKEKRPAKGDVRR